MSGAPTSRSTCSAPSERGIAYGTRVLWQRSLHSSPRTGEPSTWRRETGGRITKTFKVREMRNAETVLGIIREPKSATKPFIANGQNGTGSRKRPLESRGEIERLMPGSERGRRKSAVRQLAGGLLYRTSGSMSGMWKRGRVGLVRHPQTKGRVTERLDLNHRATSRLYAPPRSMRRTHAAPPASEVARYLRPLRAFHRRHTSEFQIHGGPVAAAGCSPPLGLKHNDRPGRWTALRQACDDSFLFRSGVPGPRFRYPSP